LLPRGRFPSIIYIAWSGRQTPLACLVCKSFQFANTKGRSTGDFIQKTGLFFKKKTCHKLLLIATATTARLRAALPLLPYNSISYIDIFLTDKVYARAEVVTLSFILGACYSLYIFVPILLENYLQKRFFGCL